MIPLSEERRVRHRPIEYLLTRRRYDNRYCITDDVHQRHDCADAASGNAKAVVIASAAARNLRRFMINLFHKVAWRPYWAVVAFGV